MTTIPHPSLTNQVGIDPLTWPFLERTHRNGHVAHLWTKQDKTSYWFNVGGRPEISDATLNQFDTYVTENPCGPNTRTHPKHKSANADVSAVNVLFADFDCKDFGSVEAILSHIGRYLPASVIVFSGGGVQCHWLAADSWLCSGPAERQAIALLQSAWVDHVGADPAAKDLARVLRVPGTWNHKPEYGAPRLVSFLHYDLDQVYEWGELLSEAADELATLTQQQERQGELTFEHRAAGGQTVLTGSDAELVEDAKKFRKMGARFERLMNGDASDYRGDESAADLGLAVLLAFLFDKDEHRIKQAMLSSGLFRDKWQREDGYLNRTIAKAANTVTSTYKRPNPERKAAAEAAAGAAGRA